MIYAPEPIIERDIDRAIAAGRQADTKIWVAAFYIHRVWRTYEVDAVAHIAQELGRDRSTVENWAHAYDLYSTLRNKFRNTRDLRKSLTPSHFWTAWELQRKFNKSDNDVVFELEQMLNYKKTRETYSAQALRQEVEAGERRNGNVPTWNYYVPRLTGTVTHFLAADCPHKELRMAAMTFIEVLKKYEVKK